MGIFGRGRDGQSNGNEAAKAAGSGGGVANGNIPKELYDVTRIFPHPDLYGDKAWQIKSRFTCVVVGFLTKFWMNCLTHVRVHNRETLMSALQDRPPKVPVITVANHHSCMDEPLLWGILDWKDVTNSRFIRWALAAHNICFSNKLHSTFFALGKSIPVVRGQGVYQPGMDFCIERLNEGAWVHVYPESRVNMTPKVNMRLKWGVGRLIAEAAVTPLVIPMYHIGMDKVLPNTKPYILRSLRNVTVLIGEPIEVKRLLKDLKEKNASEEEKRKAITDLIQVKLRKLRIEAEILHARDFPPPDP